MKKLIFLALIVLSCKKSEPSPCTLISIEEVKVLKPNHPEFYDDFDKTRVTRTDTLVCTLKGKELEKLLGFLGRSEDSLTFCIARNLAVKEVKNGKK